MLFQIHARHRDCRQIFLKKYCDGPRILLGSKSGPLAVKVFRENIGIYRLSEIGAMNSLMELSCRMR